MREESQTLRSTVDRLTREMEARGHGMNELLVASDLTLTTSSHCWHVART